MIWYDCSLLGVSRNILTYLLINVLSYLLTYHSQWSTGHRLLVSIQCCLVLLTWLDTCFSGLPRGIFRLALGLVIYGLGLGFQIFGLALVIVLALSLWPRPVNF